MEKKEVLLFQGIAGSLGEKREIKGENSGICRLGERETRVLGQEILLLALLLPLLFLSWLQTSPDFEAELAFLAPVTQFLPITVLIVIVRIVSLPVRRAVPLFPFFPGHGRGGRR